MPAHVEPGAVAGVRTAIAMASPRDLVCITGSLYLVGQAREMWRPTAQLLGHRRTS